jgi:hypothetical protein
VGVPDVDTWGIPMPNKDFLETIHLPSGNNRQLWYNILAIILFYYTMILFWQDIFTIVAMPIPEVFLS